MKRKDASFCGFFSREFRESRRKTQIPCPGCLSAIGHWLFSLYAPVKTSVTLVVQDMGNTFPSLLMPNSVDCSVHWFSVNVICFHDWEDRALQECNPSAHVVHGLQDASGPASSARLSRAFLWILLQAMVQSVKLIVLTVLFAPQRDRTTRRAGSSESFPPVGLRANVQTKHCGWPLRRAPSPPTTPPTPRK
jgi:hypothetical protein